MNQNTIANTFNSYFLSIAESLKPGNNEHTNIQQMSPVSYLIDSSHRSFPKMSWRYSVQFNSIYFAFQKSITWCNPHVYSNSQRILLLLFIMRSSDPYKARSPLDIELVNG
jgi:hypothetical protein